MYLGDFNIGDPVYFQFTTREPNGIPYTLAGSPILCVYKDSSNVEDTTAVGLTVDFDSLQGLNQVQVITTLAAGFYTSGDFTVVIKQGTVGGTQVVGEVVAHFSINNRSPLRPATAGRTIAVDLSGHVAANNVQVLKNTALSNFAFMMLDTSGSPATGLTVTAERSIDGASFASCANSVTEIAHGWYKINLAAADLNGTVIALRFSATGAADTDLSIVTVTP